MANRRDAIRMTDDELEEFLGDVHTVAVATNGADGRPHVVPLWYGFLDDAIVLETYAKAQKTVNLRRDPRVTLMIEEGERYAELRGVMITGTAEIIDDPDTVLRALESVLGRHEGLEVDDGVRDGLRQMARKRVAVKVHIDEVTSWDHRKLEGGV